MLIFKALHVLSMFTMVTVFATGAFLYWFAIWRRDVHALATFDRTAKQARLPAIGGLAVLSGIGFGLLTAATGGLDLFAGWLIAAYLLVALFVVNFALVGRHVIELGEKAVEAEAGKRPMEEVIREMPATHAGIFFGADVVILSALILDMVLKPFR